MNKYNRTALPEEGGFWNSADEIAECRAGRVAEWAGVSLRPLDTCYGTRYTCLVIRRFRHKGLEAFFLRGTTSGIQSTQAAWLRLILGRLQASAAPRDMDLPGLRLHPLAGARKGTWSVMVNANWRVTFRFEDGDAVDVNYEDYH